MNKKALRALLIVVIVAIVAVGGYFAFVKKSGPVAQQPDPTPSTTTSKITTPTLTPHPTQSPTVRDGWKTYSNSKYKFSIQYPCDAECQSSPPIPYKNAFVEDEIWLPTSNAQTQVLLFTYTDTSIKEWNDNLNPAGPGHAFPYSTQAMHNALNLEIGQSCQIFDYYIMKCSIVSLNGEKAIRLSIGTEGPNDTGAKIRYLMSRGGTLWLEVDELYNTYSSDFLVDQSKVTPELQKQISAAAEVINTLKFSK